MNKNFIRYTILLSVLILVLGSCKTRNRYINRKFHDTNARFNGYFNAKESIKEGELTLKNSYQENWDEILPIFIYPTEESAASIYPQMDRAIEKCTKVIDRHSIVEKRKEYNKWIDDCWLLIGVANFYRRDFAKSEEMFKYVTKSFKTDPNKYHAALWNARGYIQQEEFTKAGAILEKLEEDQASFPEKFMPTFYEVYSDFFLRQEQWKDAIEKLEMAINHEDQKRKRKTRLTFILAQLYQADNDSQRAIRNYVAVTKMNPSYEMEFYARINQALAFDSKLDSGTIREQLNKLLRDDKYTEFHDQIYYALAEVEFTDRNFNEGIEYLLTSAAVSEGNNKQKGKSFLRLADYYFDQRKYPVASTYFDSTITYLPSNYPNYDIIKNKKESLSDLVTNIEIIYTEDSLQRLANLDEIERSKVIDGIIDELEAEEEKRIAEEEAKRAEQLAKLNPEENKKSKGSKGGAWYFYNAAAKSAGFAEFQRVYGARSLEDNWRRKDKQSFANFDPANPEESISESISKSNVPSSEDLLKGVPLSSESMLASHEKIRKAYYDMGTIYKERLEDIDNAIETFEELAARYPDHEIAPTSYYQLYRLFLLKEASGNYFSSDSRSSSAYYRELLINEFPDSEYAKLILDPDYQTNRDLEREAILEAYEDTYRQYRRRNYNEVLLVTLDVINNDKQNELLPKYHLLRAMSIAGKKDKVNYIKTLRDIVKLYPGTEEQAEAKRLLGLLDDGSFSREEDKSGQEEESEIADKESDTEEEDEDNDIWNDDPEAAGNEPEIAEDESPFKFKESIDHFFIAVIPNKSADLNKLKRSVSDFHQNNFRNDNLKITTSFLNKDSQIILVRKFKDNEVGMNYYNVFSNNTDDLTEINQAGYPFFIISSSNFATLFKLKDVDQYMEFFSANYL